MKVKLAKVINQGSLIQVLALDKSDRLQSIPFDWRMFELMWENLSNEQKKGKDWVEINA